MWLVTSVGVEPPIGNADGQLGSERIGLILERVSETVVLRSEVSAPTDDFVQALWRMDANAQTSVCAVRQVAVDAIFEQVYQDKGSKFSQKHSQRLPLETAAVTNGFSHLGV